MIDTLHGPVSGLLASVGREIILARFRTLQSHEIFEKTPGEIVTIADKEAEEALARGLALLVPEARVVGEEATAQNPALLDGLGRGLVWLVDPVDGTSNFASGKAPFGTMIALVRDGIVEAGWLYDPVSGRLCHAIRDQGAFVDGQPLRVTASSRLRPIAALATQFMTTERRSRVEGAFAEHCDLVPIPRCAAEHYPRLALGINDVALFQRTLPWDHAAGALLLAEAGGYVTRWDGSPYRIGDQGIGIIAASDFESWRVASKALDIGERARPTIDRMDATG